MNPQFVGLAADGQIIAANPVDDPNEDSESDVDSDDQDQDDEDNVSIDLALSPIA